MKSASTQMIALLNSGQQFYKADLYTFTLKSGVVLRYASWDTDIVTGGNTYSANKLLFKRSKTKLVIGVEVDTLAMEVTAGPNDLFNGVPFLQSCQQGQLDGATVRLDYAVMSVAGVPTEGVVIQFSGSVADLEINRMRAMISVKSPFDLLNIQLPRVSYQPQCYHTLYDGGCKLMRATYLVSSSVNSGSNRSTLNCSLAQAAGYFDMGRLAFTSGVNNGLLRSVKQYLPGQIVLSYPLPVAPTVGDTFTVLPGCDKLYTTCVNKYNNKANFGGTPFVPVPETAV